MVKRLSSNIAGGGGGGGTTSPGGSDTQVQFNDGGAFGGDGGLTYNKTTDELTVAGDINLDDGGTFSTTLQSVTPTANRTISFPDATGTVALVSGSNGTVQYNDAGTLKGNSDFTVDPDWNDASTVFTGLKLNVTDTASAAGSNLLDLQVGGTSLFGFAPNGTLKLAGGTAGAIGFGGGVAGNNARISGNPSNNLAFFVANGKRLEISSTNFIVTDGIDFSLGTTTGTKIGTATTQKLSFYNATPVVQPDTTVGSATVAGGGGTTVDDATTFNGYTLAQVVQALQNLGILA